MKKPKLEVFILGLIIFLTGSESFAQTFNKRNIEYSGFFDTYYWRGPLYFHVEGGGTNYRGDLTSKLFLGSPEWSYYVGGGANYKLWPRTHVGVEANFISLTGSHYGADTVSFNSTAVELMPYIRFNLLEKRRVRHGQLNDLPYRIRPYLHAGFGALYTLNQSSTILADTTEATRVAGGGAAPALTWFVPFGIGFELWFSHRVSVLPEIIYRHSFTDFLDGIQFRNNSSGTDGYYTVGVKVQITPFAPRLNPKKNTLPPPEQYDGPKGTDYPRNPREDDEQEDTGDYDYGLPGDDGGGWDDGTDDSGDDSWDDGTGDDGWDDGTDDTGGDDGWDDSTDDSEEENYEDWGW